MTAEHHYRRLLISHISKVYVDTKLSTPKQYSYLEWTFYLRLLGESESDGSLHRRARPKPKGYHKNKKRGEATEEAGTNEHDNQPSKDGGDSDNPKWSWIGPRSPLMQEDNEAEWILKRLFVKLEESLAHQTPTSELNMDGVEHERPAGGGLET